jgi:hypothetical protein
MPVRIGTGIQGDLAVFRDQEAEIVGERVEIDASLTQQPCARFCGEGGAVGHGVRSAAVL